MTLLLNRLAAPRAGTMRHPLIVLLLLAGADAARVAGPGRVALETGGEIILMRNASEPPFVLPPALDTAGPGPAGPLCVVVRTAGEGYSLRKPGYTLGLKGFGSGPFMKSYRLAGEELNATLAVINASAVSCKLPSVWTAGVTTVFLTLDGTGRDAGNWSASTFEYFALLNPAWGRRPYVRESEGSLVVATDRSLFGQQLKLTA